MKSFINVLLIILILFTLLYFNVLEAYTPNSTTLVVNGTYSNSTSSCKRGNREQQPIHNMINNSNTANQYLVGNNIKGFL